MAFPGGTCAQYTLFAHVTGPRKDMRMAPCKRGLTLIHDCSANWPACVPGHETQSARDAEPYCGGLQSTPLLSIPVELHPLLIAMYALGPLLNQPLYEWLEISWACCLY